MTITLDKIEILALKKLSVICGALGNSLKDKSASREQLALTNVLVDVIRRAECPASDVSHWAPIDGAPKDGTAFLARNGSWYTVCCWHRYQQCWTTNGPVYSRYPADEQPLEWMPIP